MQWVMSSDEGLASRRRSWTNLVFATFTLAVSSLAMACSDPVKPAGTGGEGGNTSSSSSTGTSSGGAGGGGGAGGNAVEMPGPVEEVLKFDPIMGELPEGIAIDGTTAYIAFGSTKVITVDLNTGKRADYGSVAAPIGVGTPQGLALDAKKNVYVAVSSSNPVDFKPGIYKFAAGGGTATLFAEHVNMSYPRHIAFSSGGVMVVASPPGARMFTVMPNGTVNDPGVAQVLSGDQSSACAFGDGKPYGISSVVFDGETLLGANADRAQIIEGALMDDGSGNMFAVPGQNAELVPADCATMGGAESIIIDTFDQGATTFDVAMIVAARKINKITKIRYTGDVTVIADGTNLYEPSAIAMAVLGTDRYLYIVNSARTTFGSGGIPGLMRMRLGKAN